MYHEMFSLMGEENLQIFALHRYFLPNLSLEECELLISNLAPIIVLPLISMLPFSQHLLAL
jgi:hypothetical protein